MSEEKRFFGKYRGTVLQNLDVMMTGRIMVQCPDVQGISITSWAMPCVPIAGIQSGVFVVPAIGSLVWVEFEQGDIDYPIWVGGYWGTMGDVPAMALVPAVPPGVNIALQTPMQNTILLSDAGPPPGGITIKSRSGSMITLLDTGVTIIGGAALTITAATINVTAATALNLTAPVVTVNQGALVVT